MTNPCPYCGTLTGLHGFSFDKNGSYSKKVNFERRRDSDRMYMWEEVVD
jgi:hypothetical protein